MMPRGASIATFACLAFAACTPSAFVWDDAGPVRLRHHREAFVRAVGDRFTASMTRAQLLGQLRRERVLWLGDHHRSQRLHTLQQDLLAQLQRQGVQMAFALEAIGTQDEPAVRTYLRGDATLDELRATMRRNWSGSWLDDPELHPGHYRWLLQFAREHAIPVAALEPTPRQPIERRDQAIPLAVRALADRWPDRLLVVELGQLHLVGLGDVVGRTGRGGFVLGGEPPPSLAGAPTATTDAHVLQSDGGVWWFAALLTGAAASR